MEVQQARAIAARVSDRVQPAIAFCALTVSGGHSATYCIWTVENNNVHQHLLDASCTSEERLEAHLRGFVANWAQKRGIDLAEATAAEEARQAQQWEDEQAQVRWAEAGGYAAGLPRPGASAVTLLPLHCVDNDVPF